MFDCDKEISDPFSWLSLQTRVKLIKIKIFIKIYARKIHQSSINPIWTLSATGSDLPICSPILI